MARCGRKICRRGVGKLEFQLRSSLTDLLPRLGFGLLVKFAGKLLYPTPKRRLLHAADLSKETWLKMASQSA